jgi:Fe2+ transport system protein FeoA
MDLPSETSPELPLSFLPLHQTCRLADVLDESLRQQFLQFGIERGSPLERLSIGQGIQPLVLRFDGLTLALLPQALDLIRIRP